MFNEDIIILPSLCNYKKTVETKSFNVGLWIVSDSPSYQCYSPQCHLILQYFILSLIPVYPFPLYVKFPSDFSDSSKNSYVTEPSFSPELEEIFIENPPR